MMGMVGDKRVKARVLFVDDDIEVIRGYRDFLEDRFEILLVSTVEQALEILRSNEIHVLVVDLVMPGKDGRALLAEANKAHRRPIKIVLSAYVEEAFNHEFQNEFRIYAALKKPMRKMEALIRMIEEAYQEYQFRFGGVQGEEPMFLNAEEIMLKLGVSRPTLYKYLHLGLPSKQVHGRRFFDWGEVITWIDRQPNVFGRQSYQRKD